MQRWKISEANKVNFKQIICTVTEKRHILCTDHLTRNFSLMSFWHHGLLSGCETEMHINLPTKLSFTSQISTLFEVFWNLILSITRILEPKKAHSYKYCKYFCKSGGIESKMAIGKAIWQWWSILQLLTMILLENMYKMKKKSKIFIFRTPIPPPPYEDKLTLIVLFSNVLSYLIRETDNWQ